MNVERYLKKIKYAGKIRHDFETLCALHKAHMLAIPYENLDIHLERPVLLDDDLMYEKLIEHSRGGWCYENNIMFGRLLDELGFEVTLVGILSLQMLKWFREWGEGEREMRHPAIKVEIDESYLADVGDGKGPLVAVPFPEASAKAICPTGRSVFQEDIRWFEQSPHSPHKRDAVCVRMLESNIIELHDRRLKIGSESRLIATEAEYCDVLRNLIEIDIDAGKELWSGIRQRESIGRSASFDMT